MKKKSKAKKPELNTAAPKRKRGRPANPLKQKMLAETTKQGSKDRRPKRKNRDGDPTRTKVNGQTVIVREVVRQNGVTRPSPTWRDGTPKVTFVVWDTADKISAKMGRPAQRNEVGAEIDKHNQRVGKEAAVSYFVFQSEFYRWRKFNGITSQPSKPGKRTRGRPKKQPVIIPVEEADPSEFAGVPIVATQPASTQTEFAFSALPELKEVETPAPCTCEPCVEQETAPATPPPAPVKPPLPPKPAAPAKKALPWAVPARA